MPAAPLHALDVAVLTRWLLLSRDALEAAREEIDELNVYPVPDGDTGTNLHLTVEAAARALADDAAAKGDAVNGDGGHDDGTGGGLAEAVARSARGALLGARGNSGVILSQMLQGFADAVRAEAPRETSVGPSAVARALGAAADAAYAAVAAPVEGTMLTVARAAARACAEAAREGGGAPALGAVVSAGAAAAREALARTPEQLEVLARAGVVDAGGRGVCVLLDALEAIVLGRSMPEAAPREPAGGAGAAAHVEQRERRWAIRDEGGPAYEVMYLLDAPAEAIPPLRDALAPLGDSLVVVGAEPTWNVHVHVDDVGAAVEAGVVAGRPHRIRVTHFADAARKAVGAAAAERRGVLSVVAGEGLAALFETAGATVIPGGPGRRASTAEMLAGLRLARARDVIVLPNDADSLAVAEAAAASARDEGLRVAVIPTRASVQAIAALAVHDTARRFEDDVVAMTAAAGHCRHGGVTVAARDAVTMAGVCSPGDVLGIVDGDFVVIGDDLAAVACTVVDRMLGGGGELVTLVTGQDAPEATPAQALAEAVVDHLRRTRPEVDTVVYEGGQPRYPLLVGVE